MMLKYVDLHEQYVIFTPWILAAVVSHVVNNNRYGYQMATEAFPWFNSIVCGAEL